MAILTTSVSALKEIKEATLILPIATVSHQGPVTIKVRRAVNTRGDDEEY
jgi:hypothetical protein